MKSRSLAMKLSVVIILLIVFSAVVTGAFGYALYRRDSIALNADRALSVARSVARVLDPEQYKAIVASGEKSDYWHWFKGYLDQVLNDNELMYLYVLDGHYGADVTYFAEGVGEKSDPDDIFSLGETDSAEEYGAEMFATMDTGKAAGSGIYESGDYGYAVSGYAPVLDNSGQVIAVVGVDLGVDEVVRTSNAFGAQIIGIMAAYIAIAGWVSVGLIRRMVGKPITALTRASRLIAEGDTRVEMRKRSNDEIGRLVDSFGCIVDSTKKQIAVMESLARGDLTAEIETRSVQDAMNGSIRAMIANLNGMFTEISASASEVSAGAKQIADGAQSLAQGAMEQSSAVQELSASISVVARQTRENAQKAEQASALTGRIMSNAQNGSEQMNRMTAAVSEINGASAAISEVIKVINDIAFQTNILALNASIEAASAGQHGRAFAVVAEEVRSLASKSAIAANDTESLIANTMTKAELGARIAAETADALAQIVSGIRQSSALIQDIATSAEQQSTAIMQIDRGIERVSQVVATNSAIVEESAAASALMSDQSGVLESLVSRFKLKEGEQLEQGWGRRNLSVP